jgi:hypothetical protein
LFLGAFQEYSFSKSVIWRSRLPIDPVTHSQRISPGRRNAESEG